MAVGNRDTACCRSIYTIGRERQLESNSCESDFRDPICFGPHRSPGLGGRAGEIGGADLGDGVSFARHGIFRGLFAVWSVSPGLDLFGARSRRALLRAKGAGPLGVGLLAAGAADEELSISGLGSVVAGRDSGDRRNSHGRLIFGGLGNAQRPGSSPAVGGNESYLKKCTSLPQGHGGRSLRKRATGIRFRSVRAGLRGPANQRRRRCRSHHRPGPLRRPRRSSRVDRPCPASQ